MLASQMECRMKIRAHHGLFLNLFLASAASALAQSALYTPAAPGEWTGVYRVIIQHPAEGPPRYLYLVSTADADLELHFPAETPAFKSGTLVRVRGRRTARTIDVQEFQALLSPHDDPSCGTTGERKIAALLLNFPGTP